MATKPDKIRQLSPEQELAIEALLQGKTDKEAAEIAGVSRQTVNTWKNHDSLFIAELNSRRRVIWEGYLERLRGLLGLAIEALEADLRQTDDRKLRQAAAFQVLKSVGLAEAKLEPRGATTPEEVDIGKALAELARL